jgi:hypothetical protein
LFISVCVHFSLPNPPSCPSSDDIQALQEQLTFWRNEATAWRQTSIELNIQLEKALELLSAAGIELPVGSTGHLPPSPTRGMNPSVSAKPSTANSWLIKIAKKREKEREREREKMKKTVQDIFKKDPTKKRSKLAGDAYRSMSQFYAPIAASYHDSDSIAFFLDRLSNMELVPHSEKQQIGQLEWASSPSSEPILGTQTLKDMAAATCWSTYPLLATVEGVEHRAGDPIADSYAIRMWRNRGVVCVCDGCGWGPRARTASIKANQAFMECVEELYARLVSLPFFNFH